MATERPKRVLAQVMSRGDYQDVLLVLEQFGERQLREVIGSAEAGWFDDRSWHYWHYKLGLAEPGRVPPSPVRRFG